MKKTQVCHCSTKRKTKRKNALSPAPLQSFDAPAAPAAAPAFVIALLPASTFLLTSATTSLGTAGGLQSHAAPSTTSVSPEAKREPADESHTQAIAMSHAEPNLPRGTSDAIAAAMSSLPPGESGPEEPESLLSPAVPAIGPGATPQTLTPNSPHSRARERVSASTAAFAAQAWACHQVAP